MNNLAIIGGSGFHELPEFTIHERKSVQTPFGEPSASLSVGEIFGLKVAFLPRHGDKHSIAPHKVNYRANIFSLKAEGITQVISLAAVGGITAAYKSRSIAIPHQIIDYTWGREHTCFDGTKIPGSIVNGEVNHVDFSNPFDESLRSRLVQAASRSGIDFRGSGIYGVTQGPRFETAAEINRMDRDGADMVGMTAMPEAALARELGIAYACIAMVVNAAAGRGEDELSMEEIVKNLAATSTQALAVLENLV